MKATYDDAKLILQLYEMRREPRLREARKWFTASFKPKSYDDFTTMCPPGSEPNASYRMVVTYWEMVASFITNGVLNQQLFFQSGREILFVWERVRDLIPLVREAEKDPTAYSNLEKVSVAFISWMNSRAPEAYGAFSARVRGA